MFFPSPTEIAAAQAHARRERWEYTCQVLGATTAQIRAFDESAVSYAQTTLWPNGDVIDAARAAALRRLKRGETMPSDAAVLHQEDNARAQARWLGERT